MEPDCILAYLKTEKEIIFEKTGTHQIFSNNFRNLVDRF
jgi:mRNA-degrading endonuclease YafQ of YafQ-DinJ toxin-antitoxin module